MSQLVLDCLLPNGVVIPLSCTNKNILRNLKDELWKESRKYPFETLGAPEDYIFSGVNLNAQPVELFDESLALCDAGLYSPFLKVVRRKGTKEETILNQRIGFIIGRSVYDLDVKDEELQAFRKNIFHLVEESVNERQKNGFESMALYQHPPELELTPKLPLCVNKHLDDGFLTLQVWHGASDSVTVRVLWDDPPSTVLSQVLNRLSVNQDKSAISLPCAERCVLKICGTNEYLLLNRPLTQYKTVRDWLSRDKTPQLSLVSRGDLYASCHVTQLMIPYYLNEGTEVGKGKANDDGVSLWHPSIAGKLAVRVGRVHQIPIGVKEVHVDVAVYFGGKCLCSVIGSGKVTVGVEWSDWMQLHLDVGQVPRGSVLCVGLRGEWKAGERKRKRDKETSISAWGNICLFDWHDSMMTATSVTMTTWEGDCLINPFGLTVSCRTKDSICVDVEIDSHQQLPILFPDEGQIEDYANYIQKLEKRKLEELPTRPDVEDMKRLSDLTRSDSALSDEEQSWLWSRRDLWQVEGLPRLLKAVEWSCRDQVSQLYLLLKKWPLVSVETALELLQMKYCDQFVREFAVRSLEFALPDERLAQFLLQLVQTLKREPFLDCPLLRFLLKRALRNSYIGHQFFWHVRSEMNIWPGPLRAAAILEAYCRGLGANLDSLIRHVEMVEKMMQLTDILKEKKCDNNKESSKHLKELLSSCGNDSLSPLQHLTSPIHPSQSLGRLRLSECRVVDSGRRPLCLVWENADPMGQRFSLSHGIIFKTGDDLRQDMLILQLMNIMSQAWLEQDLDLRIVSYSCLATAKQTGMIEVVRDARTVYSIQRRARLGAIQVDSSQLYKWIRDKNPGLRLDQAIDNFTRSCAGYCVATFVLGIGDRHPDNIMVHEDGRIFHIDFGHFLGNTKKKFGLNRERVPFVLTQDFLRVITNGNENARESVDFQKFQQLCGKAYLVLRQKAQLFLNLFALLLFTGMPELQSEEDLSYLRRALAVGLTEEEALMFFMKQFDDAHSDAWTTKVDWFFHSMKHK